MANGTYWLQAATDLKVDRNSILVAVSKNGQALQVAADGLTADRARLLPLQFPMMGGALDLQRAIGA